MLPFAVLLNAALWAMIVTGKVPVGTTEGTPGPGFMALGLIALVDLGLFVTLLKRSIRHSSTELWMIIAATLPVGVFLIPLVFSLQRGAHDMSEEK